jgi:hypothetical protein
VAECIEVKGNNKVVAFFLFSCVVILIFVFVLINALDRS